MIQEDFYTGEPTTPGSLPCFQNPNIINTGPTAETEAANMASFGRYDYEAGYRQQAIATAPAQLTGGYGGNFNPYGGIGAPPPYYNGYNQYYNNPQPTYSYYRPYQQQPFYQQQQYQQPTQPTTYTIPGVNPFGEFMPSSNYQDQIGQMEMEYFNRQQEMDVKQTIDRQGSVYGGFNSGYGFNYYGVPYFNPYQYNALNNEFQNRIRAMQDEARANRMNFNLNISRLAHNFSKDGISDEDIRERYTGKTVDIPQAYLQPINEYNDQIRFMNLIPFDNSQMYRDHRAAIQKEFSDVIPADADLKEAFGKLGIIQAKWDLEDEMHRRRDAGALYNSGDNSYKYFVKQKAAERYAKEKGISTQVPAVATQFNANNMVNSYINSNPVLSQAAQLADDGTLNVSFSLPCNVGTHKGETYHVHNSQESEYEEKRLKFGSFLDSIPSTIYLDDLKNKKLEEYGNG